MMFQNHFPVVGAGLLCLASTLALAEARPQEAGAEQEPQACELLLPDLAVFAQHFANRGQTRAAYDLGSKQHAIEAGRCDCAASWPFEAFLEQHDLTPDTLTQPDIRALRRWTDKNGVQILRDYRAFRANNCGEE